MKLQIGSKLPKFKLKGVDEIYYSDSDFSNYKILVIMFTCNHCPYVQAYEERLINLQKDYLDKEVKFVAINSNDDIEYPEDNFTAMVNRSKVKGYNFPYLRDDTQNTAKDFGASYTPEIFVFNSKKELQYNGRIDDNWQEADKATKHNLKDAINSILNNIEIDRKNTQAIGCTVKWKA